jgi:hypothetical protein
MPLQLPKPLREVGSRSGPLFSLRQVAQYLQLHDKVADLQRGRRPHF